MFSFFYSIMLLVLEECQALLGHREMTRAIKCLHTHMTLICVPTTLENRTQVYICNPELGWNVQTEGSLLFAVQ